MMRSAKLLLGIMLAATSTAKPTSITQLVTLSEGRLQGHRFIIINVIFPSPCGSVLTRRKETDDSIDDWSDAKKIDFVRAKLINMCIDPHTNKCGCEALKRLEESQTVKI